MGSQRILVVGGSTRAAADSVRRAGWQPVCADLYADIDLRETAEVIPIRSYPYSLPDDVAHVRADAWFYCGALENHPEIVERIATTNRGVGKLLGSNPHAIKLVRDPYWLTNTLRWEGITMLDVATQSSPPPADSSWLQKPLASAGGRLIRVWNESAARNPFPEPHYFQTRARGVALSVIFRIENRDATWLGASQEIGAIPGSCPPSEFSYCGSCGPLPEVGPPAPGSHELEFLPPSARKKVHQIAKILALQAKGLQGLVGLDFRLDGNEVWLTEVNPRYTASVELLELATGRSFLDPCFQASSAKDDHEDDEFIPSTLAANGSHKVVVKQILYANRRITAPDFRGWLRSADPWQIPAIADIPVEGACIESGWPICTVMAAGENREQAETTIHHRLSLISQALFDE